MRISPVAFNYGVRQNVQNQKAASNPVSFGGDTKPDIQLPKYKRDISINSPRPQRPLSQVEIDSGSAAWDEAKTGEDVSIPGIPVTQEELDLLLWKLIEEKNITDRMRNFGAKELRKHVSQDNGMETTKIFNRHTGVVRYLKLELRNLDTGKTELENEEYYYPNGSIDYSVVKNYDPKTGELLSKNDKLYDDERHPFLECQQMSYYNQGKLSRMEVDVYHHGCIVEKQMLFLDSDGEKVIDDKVIIYTNGRPIGETVKAEDAPRARKGKGK